MGLFSNPSQELLSVFLNVKKHDVKSKNIIYKMENNIQSEEFKKINKYFVNVIGK